MAILSRFSILLLLGGLVSASGAVLNTGLTVSVGGTNVSSALGLPTTLAAGRNAFSLPTTVTVPSVWSITSLSYSSFDDPNIFYSMSGINLMNTSQTISFTFLMNYVGGPYTTLTDSFQLGVTDSNTNGAVTVALVSPQTVIAQPQVDGVNRDGQGTGCTLTGTPGFSSTCGPTFSSAVLTIPTTGATGTFQTTVTFNISPGDTYTFSGSTILGGTTTPEPATYSYLAGGIGLLLFAGRKRFLTIAKKSI